ncbi:hypothetical protein GCM10027564_15620 [Luteimonas notoginsengisoli]
MVEPTLPALSMPTVVWSGIVAALISLGGIVLSNWSTARRLRIQLEHDAREKLKDRLGLLRKEVYLQLYSDIAAMQGHLGSLSSKDPTSPDFGAPVQGANTQLAKVQLVGSDEVMKHASELQALYTESLFALMIAAKPLHELRTDIALADQFYNRYLKEAERVTGEITAMNETGRPDPAANMALQRSFDSFREQYTNYANERSEAWESYSSSQSGFVQVVTDQVARVAPTQAKLMAALKNEIGVKTDVAVLLTQLEKNQVRMESGLKEVLARFSPPKA